LGSRALKFADFLHEAGQSWWQILPLNPTDLRYDSTPYHSTSAFAGNPLLLSPEMLVREELLSPRDLDGVTAAAPERVRYREAVAIKARMLPKVFERFRPRMESEAYRTFCRDHALWLDDFALFEALKGRFGPEKPWCDWPEPLRDRRPEAIASARAELKEEIEKARCFQYLFHGQWARLKEYCNSLGVQFIGDIPIYIDFDSADVWARPHLFKLDGGKRPYVVAGVPPDYFSATGQRWGNPIYDWDAHRSQNFEWWVRRILHNLDMFDWLRIDHFRGLVAYWEVPAHEETAMNGRWVEAPVYELFARLERRRPKLPLIAEDLGLITPDVREAMARLKLPGMKVLLFAFGWDMPKNPYIPHNVPVHSVIYTGTHDNNTARGWFENEASPEEKERVFKYLGRKVSPAELPGELIRIAMMSCANAAIFPLQDCMSLGAEARMNRPTTIEGNWRWRYREDQLTQELVKSLRGMTERSEERRVGKECRSRWSPYH